LIDLPLIVRHDYAMKNPRHILITGASSGIGAALALAYADGADVRLFLQGRNQERLNRVAEQAQALGAKVETAVFDVREAVKVMRWIESCDAQAPLDLVIANAGIAANNFAERVNDAVVDEIFAVNLHGVLNTIHPAMRLMARRGRGQIAIMSSLAGYRGLPKEGAYAASKAAVRVYGEALRPELALKGVQLSVVCPGFIKTPLTDRNRFSMPFLLSVEGAAKIIQAGLAKNKARIAFPWPMKILASLFALFPVPFIERCIARLPEKGSA
jgi:short-subunit dehydrogenase